MVLLISGVNTDSEAPLATSLATVEQSDTTYIRVTTLL